LAYRYAARFERPTLVLVGGMDAGRDFTGGAARRLWEAALAGGAVRVDTEAEVTGAVERLIRMEA
ncbi:MAG: hypothetical protein XD74_1505, partial [Actinobacteria bacterium 66_15]